MKEFYGVFISGGLFITIVSMISWWVLFKKAGYKGWYAIIPICNLYIFCKIVTNNGWWFIAGFIPFINIFVAFYLLVRLSKVFQHGFLYALGLIFFYPIFILALAFGSSKYQYI